MKLRIAAIVILLVSVCTAPLVVTLCLAVVSLALFRNFYELIPLFFVNDAMYGAAEHHFFSFPYVMTMIAIVLVFGSIALSSAVFETSTFS